MNVFDLLATVSFLLAVVSLFAMFTFNMVYGFCGFLFAMLQAIAWDRIGEMEKEIERLKEQKR